MVLGHLWSQKDGIMSWLRLTATQTASYIHIRYIQSVWAHWYAVHGHKDVASNIHNHTTWVRFLGFVVTCGVKMMWLCLGWGWQPPQTAYYIHIRLIPSVGAHWYAVHGHSSTALNRYTPMKTTALAPLAVVAVSTKSLLLLGTLHSEDLWRLMATSARRRTKMRL